MSSGYEDRCRFFVPAHGENSARLFVGDIENEGERFDAAIGEWCAFVCKDEGRITNLIVMSEWLEKLQDTMNAMEREVNSIKDDLDMAHAVYSGRLDHIKSVKDELEMLKGMLDLESRDYNMSSGVFGVLSNWEGSIEDSLDDDGEPTMHCDKNGALTGFFSDKVRVGIIRNVFTGEVEGVEVRRPK